MAHSKQEAGHLPNSLASMPVAFNNPVLTIFANMSGTVLEALATAQKDWAEFMQRRIREELAVRRQLLNCHSLAEMHLAYAHYLQTALKQYQEQSERLAQRGQAGAQHLAAAVEGNAKDAERASARAIGAESAV